MIAALVLLAYAILAATLGARVLSRATALRRSPRWAIGAWQALSFSIVGAVVLALLAVAAPLLLPPEPAPAWLGATQVTIQHHYATPGGTVAAWAALGLAVLLVVAILTSVIVTVVGSGQRRRAQLDAVALVAVEHPDGYHVLDSASPLVYCLPGRHRRVVVTTAALGLLADRELALVLAHERTHLRARHDLVLAVSGGLRRVLPLPVLALAHETITTLVEMQADDAARNRGDRVTMARALLRLSLSTPSAPPAALAAGDVGAAARVRRLTGVRRPWRVRHSLVSAMATMMVLAAPVGLAVAPAVGATALGCCDVREYSTRV